MFVMAEPKTTANLADIHLLACDARERIYASCVVGCGGVCILGRFEMLGNGVVAPEGCSYICVLEQVSDFVTKGVENVNTAHLVLSVSVVEDDSKMHGHMKLKNVF
jgi:hypothetical protein